MQGFGALDASHSDTHRQGCCRYYIKRCTACFISCGGFCLTQRDKTVALDDKPTLRHVVEDGEEALAHLGASNSEAQLLGGELGHRRPWQRELLTDHLEDDVCNLGVGDFLNGARRWRAVTVVGGSRRLVEPQAIASAAKHLLTKEMLAIDFHSLLHLCVELGKA